MLEEESFDNGTVGMISNSWRQCGNSRMRARHLGLGLLVISLSSAAQSHATLRAVGSSSSLVRLDLTEELPRHLPRSAETRKRNDLATKHGAEVQVEIQFSSLQPTTRDISMPAANSTPVAALLLTVFNSILEVFLLCLAGYILAKQGILDKKTQKQINHLNVNLFTPALLFSKVAFFLSPGMSKLDRIAFAIADTFVEKLRELWIVPIFFVIVTLVSMLVACCLSYFVGLKRSQRNFAMAAAMFMNSNSLPIALMQSLVVSVPGLKWTPDDNRNAMVGRALTYLVLYSTLGMVVRTLLPHPLSLFTLGTHRSTQVRWSVGVQLLSQADEDAVPDPPLVDITDDDDDHSSTTDLASSPHPGPGASTSTFVGTPTSESPRALSPHPDITSNPNPHLRLQPPERHTTYYLSFPNSPSQEETPLPPDDTPPPSHPASASLSPYAGTPYGSNDALPLPLHSSPPPVARVRPSVDVSLTHANANTLSLDTRIPHTTRHRTSLPRRLLRKLRRSLVALRNFMTPPLWAALLSVVVACTRPVQHLLEAHWLSVKGALAAAGNCSIPLTLVVLGAYFYTPPSSESQEGGRKGKGRGGGGGAMGKGGKGGKWWNVDVRGFLGMRQPIMLPVDPEGENENANGSGYANGNGNANGIIGAARDGSKHARAGETKTVVIAVLSRMVLTPVILMPLLILSAKLNWQKVFDDPVFMVSNVLLLSSPPALTLAQITQAASGDAFERLISRTIFWSYCVLTPPATIVYVVVGLLLTKL
ncbi:hypothetical protein C0995_009358 [Termitomyces sp. Mi166|nr:hypothetical protein C0995_009358 [Termitomyces sp. Mi166\